MTERQREAFDAKILLLARETFENNTESATSELAKTEDTMASPDEAVENPNSLAQVPAMADGIASDTVEVSVEAKLDSAAVNGETVASTNVFHLTPPQTPVSTRPLEGHYTKDDGSEEEAAADTVDSQVAGGTQKHGNGDACLAAGDDFWARAHVKW